MSFGLLNRLPVANVPPFDGDDNGKGRVCVCISNYPLVFMHDIHMRETRRGIS